MCLAGNGTIDYEEFCIIMRDLVTVAMEMEERIRTTFYTMDLDGDGKISHEELKKVQNKKQKYHYTVESLSQDINYTKV